MPTFDQALALERNKDALTAGRRGHTGGVSFGGMTGSIVMRSEAQLEAAAREMVEHGDRIAATPNGRFLACVMAAEQIAFKAGNNALIGALERAADCARRGLEEPMNRDFAGKALREAELLGADVRSAQQALADAAGAQMAAE